MYVDQVAYESPVCAITYKLAQLSCSKKVISSPEENF